MRRPGQANRPRRRAPPRVRAPRQASHNNKSRRARTLNGTTPPPTLMPGGPAGHSFSRSRSPHVSRSMMPRALARPKDPPHAPENPKQNGYGVIERGCHQAACGSQAIGDFPEIRCNGQYGFGGKTRLLRTVFGSCRASIYLRLCQRENFAKLGRIFER